MLQLDIITLEKTIYSATIDAIVVPTTSGEITILPNHIPLISQIASGEMTIKKQNKDQHIAITGGFIEVNNNRITILADYAVRSEDIETAKAEEAKKRAEKLVSEKIGKEDFAQAQAQLRKSLLELKIV